MIRSPARPSETCTPSRFCEKDSLARHRFQLPSLKVSAQSVSELVRLPEQAVVGVRIPPCDGEYRGMMVLGLALAGRFYYWVALFR